MKILAQLGRLLSCSYDPTSFGILGLRDGRDAALCGDRYRAVLDQRLARFRRAGVPCDTRALYAANFTRGWLAIARGLDGV